MRKYFSLSLIILGCLSTIPVSAVSQSTYGSDSTGQTFYTVRPLYQSAMPEKISLFRDRALVREAGWGGVVDFTVFGGKTTRAKGMGEYFMFDHKSQLVVDSNSSNLLRDVNPLNFNIQYGNITEPYEGSFSSVIQFRPKQSVVGFGMTWRQYLGFFNDCCEPMWWLEVGVPVYHVRNNMYLTETDIATTGDQRTDPVSAANMVEAFTGTIAYPNGSTWNYGKIDGSRKKTSVAEVEFKVGYDCVDTECAHVDGYIGALIPTSNRPKGVYVFEPIAGYGHQAGIIFGGCIEYKVWENCDKSIYWAIDTDSRYLFSNTQTRSFDLNNRAWSRYALTIADHDAAVSVASSTTLEQALTFMTPGINIFTRKVKVTPRLWTTINSALVYESCGFRGELGYNFWARQSEKVRLKTAWVEGPAIANLDPSQAYGQDSNITNAFIVNRLSDIGNDSSGAGSAGVLYIDSTTTGATPETITIIRPQDLNLQSAANPGAISNMIYAAGGFHWDDLCYPIYAGVGGSYEFNNTNAAVSRWNLWGKFGVSI